MGLIQRVFPARNARSWLALHPLEHRCCCQGGEESLKEGSRAVVLGSDGLGIMVQGHEVVEGINGVELASVDQAHEDVADLGSAERFVTQGVSPVEDRRFQGAFADIMPPPDLCRVAN